jgi:hypothetical protein
LIISGWKANLGEGQVAVGGKNLGITARVEPRTRAYAARVS